MSMHLEGPWLSTTGKRKGKIKFKNAEQARQARELAQSWEQLKNKYKTTVKSVKNVKPMNNVRSTYRRETPKIPSLNNGVDMSPAFKNQQKVYTGTKIIGIGTMHKSNAVPIFSDSEAQEIASMRR